MSQPNQPTSRLRHKRDVGIDQETLLNNYFKQCDDSTATIRVRCVLCSLELSKETASILWNHIKSKHPQCLDSNRTHDPQQNVPSNNDSAAVCADSQQATTTATATVANRITFTSEKNMTETKQSPILKTRTNRLIDDIKTTSGSDESNSISRVKKKTPASGQQVSNKNQLVEQYLDYNDYNVMASNKPLASSSMSKNLISRLNQISSPITRKLKFWNKKSFQVNQYDPNFKAIYLGNLSMQFWSKDESCLDKPLGTLWNNYVVNMKTEIVMRITICNSGLKVVTRQHGMFQYWSNRILYCCSHKNYPRIFSWIYRHERKKMRQELRCHAAFCPSQEKAVKMVAMLNQRLACALQEFRREKKSRSLSLVSSLTSEQTTKLPRTVPLRRKILAKGSANFRPPLERSKSAFKLTSITEEDQSEEEESEDEEEDEDDLERDEDERSAKMESIMRSLMFSDEPPDEDQFHEIQVGYDDDNDQSDFEDEEDINRNNLDSSQKIDSNSLTITINDGTSNGSVSVTATTTGNSPTGEPYQQHQQPSISSSSNGTLNGLPVDYNNEVDSPYNEYSSSSKQQRPHSESFSSRGKLNEYVKSTKDSVTVVAVDHVSTDNPTNSSDKTTTSRSSHKSTDESETHQSSANINSSSFSKHKISSAATISTMSPDGTRDDSSSSGGDDVGKADGTISNKMELQESGVVVDPKEADEESQEIISSWSNFVIK